MNKKSFNYALSIGSFNKKFFIKILDKEASEAQTIKEKKGIDTVIVLDNYSVHTSHDVQEKEKLWQSKGLYLFFLPTYSPEMNLIETEWHQIKADEICGRMFEDEYDLAIAVKSSIQKRSNKRGECVRQFKFNSKSINIEI